jgi:energy-coupling factor transporter ATP-binding protein EcfA2
MSTEAVPGPSPYCLQSISATGFRSLAECGPIPLSGNLTVLTGQNDGGKTSVLDAVAFLLSESRPDDRDHRSLEVPISIVGVFRTVNGSDSVTIRLIRETDGAITRSMLDVVHREFDTHPVDVPINELRAAIARLSIPNPGGQRKGPLVKAVDEWISERPADEFSEMWVPIPGVVADRLPGLQRFTSTSALAPDRYIAAFVEREVHRFMGDEPHDGLESVIKDVEMMVASRVSKLREKILQHCPEFGDIGIDVHTDFTRPRVNVDLSLVDATGHVFFSKEGEGMRRRVTLAIQEGELEALEEGASESISMIAMYDEPDTHLDYTAQRSLFDLLERQAGLGGVQVVVATHSRNFIDRANLDSLIHLALDNKRQTTIERLVDESHSAEARFLGSICAGLGLRNSVLLDERVFLIVEGDTEEAAAPELFRTCIGRSMNAAGVHIVNTRGSGSIRRVVEVIATDWQRGVVVMTDADVRSDVRTTSWLTRFGVLEGRSLFFVGIKEFEDAFSDAVWVRALNNGFRPGDGSEWAETDIAECRQAEKFSVALLNKVKSRVRNAEVSKPDLGIALAEAVETRDDVPKAVSDCFRAAYEHAHGGVNGTVSAGSG